jgi:CRP-like cAMP-binding protein
VARPVLSPAIQATWHDSALRKALGASADDLLVGARETTFECGEVIYDMARADPPRLVLIAEGLVRVYYTSIQGRQATIRYATPGHTIGLPVMMAPAILAEDRMLAMQALATCHVLEFSAAQFRRAAESDAKNMWPLFSELARSLMDGQRFLSHNVFQPVRARVARHLLDLSVKRSDGLVVSASQQDIADAIGSVREVVSRVVVQLRDDGLIRRNEGVYVILNPTVLHKISEME